MTEDKEVNKEIVEKTQEEVLESLDKIYEDDEVIVLAAPDDSELEKLIIEILSKQPMKFKELKEVFSATAGEDRLRKALQRLAEKGLVHELEDGTYVVSKVTEYEEEYAEYEEGYEGGYEEEGYYSEGEYSEYGGDYDYGY